tara:strand:+ start:742 stop:978 length:237 start_codon:yes stop_codon:yes gene_type:complete
MAIYSMSKTYTPVELSILEFGGLRKLAKAVGRDPAAVSRWKRNGTVPTSVQKHLLEVAWSKGLTITAHEIVFGRLYDD